jgi:hypothetical protein
MTRGSSELVNRGKIAERVDFLAPAVCGSIALAIFAVVTQLLATTGAISLSATQLLAIWLVAAALMVLLWITYMICRAYVTDGARAAPPASSKSEANGAPEQFDQAPWDVGPVYYEPQAENRVQVVVPEEPEQGLRDGSSRNNDGPPPSNGSAGEDETAWVPPRELRHLVGTERPVSTAEVFPKGCYLQPDSIRLDEKDKLTGRPVYQCRVVDPNSTKDRPHETTVNILADRPPVPPTGEPYERVGFHNLTITPYVTDRSPMRIRYSLRATGIHAAGAPLERVEAVWSASSNGHRVGGDQMPEHPALSR